MLCIEIRPSKRSDAPYGSFDSVLALAKAAMTKTSVYSIKCGCGAVFESEQPFALYCEACKRERKRKAALRTALKKKGRRKSEAY